MNISADAVLFSSDYQRDLTVSLEILESVYNVTAGFLKLFGPLDIVLFVKPGFELYKDRDLLAVFSCSCERRDDRRIAADTVKSLFDRKHIRIYRSSCNKLHNRVKSLIRMMHENIAFSDLLENIAARREFGDKLGLGVSVLPKIVVAFDPVSLHKVSKIKRTVDLVYEIHAQGKLFH